MSWPDFAERISDKTVAVLPVGSIEQHGYHAPLGTDLFIAEGLAATAEGYDHVIVLPSIPVGVAEYHRHFAGSLWVSPEVLKQYVGGIIRSLKYHGVKKVIIVNGHGGNREPLKEMARYLKMEEDVFVVVWTWFESIEQDIVAMYGFRPPLHADETETSMLMAVAPDTINKEKLKDSADNSSDVWGKFYNGTMVSQEVRDFSRSGATGNPVKANLEQGQTLFQLSKNNLRELIEYVSLL